MSGSKTGSKKSAAKAPARGKAAAPASKGQARGGRGAAEATPTRGVDAPAGVAEVAASPSEMPRLQKRYREEIRRFLDKLTAPIDTVARQVGAQVGAGRDEGRLGTTGLGHVEQRARLRVALAEQQEVERQLERHDDEVRLDVRPRRERPDAVVGADGHHVGQAQAM